MIRLAMGGSSFSSVFSATPASRTVQAKVSLYVGERHRAAATAAKDLDRLVVVHLLKTISDQPFDEPIHADALAARAGLQRADERRVDFYGGHASGINVQRRAWSAQRATQQAARLGIDAAALSLARPGDVQHADAVTPQPGAQAPALTVVAQLQDQRGLVVALARIDERLQRAAGKPTAREDQRAVRVAHVPLGALQVIHRRRLVEAIAAADAAVFGDAPARAPAAAGDAERAGDIERRAVDARLAAGYDHGNHRPGV